MPSFRAPTLWFIDLTVATYHTQYIFLSLCRSFARENGQNTKNTRSPPFSYDTKMAADGYWARKALILTEAYLIGTAHDCENGKWFESRGISLS